MKVALLHYWLVKMRGGEKVLKEICTLFPAAPIFTHAYDPEGVDPVFHAHRVQCSFLGRMPLAKTCYTHYLPLMPLATRLLDVKGYDLIISSESGPIKGIQKSSSTVHICYCHTPMRYIWDMYDDYFEHAGFAERMFMNTLKGYLRRTDLMSAESVDHFVANSEFVAERIQRIYGRSSTVIYPPVDIELFENTTCREKEDYYLLAGHLTHYKRPDIAVKAFNRNGKKLVVVGIGEEWGRLRKIAGRNISFVGSVDDEELRRLYTGAKALIFPGIEDFGIVPVEAQACGTPVIAYKKGGALETVLADKTGLFFPEQTAESLCGAIEEFESKEGIFECYLLREHARRFSSHCFRERFAAFVREKMGTLVLQNSEMCT
ncbi:MAG: glycosyltransferase [Desulforhabdus sp.]|nr:glycosyltransferase [Desulforhabdus sp.]